MFEPLRCVAKSELSCCMYF